MGGSYFNETFNFLNEWDDLDDMDFPLADVELNDAEEDWKAKLQCLEPPLNVLESFSSYLVPCDESLQMKQWPSGSDLSNIVTSLPYNSSEGKYSHTLQTCSPVSVLESNCSSSSCSAENPIPCLPKFVIPVKRPRSKRSCIRRCKFPVFVLPCASKRFHRLTASELDTEFHAGELTLNSANKRQKKKQNLTQVSSEVEITEPSLELGEARKCAHCQVTKTPQWREGPLGPKTLCNACGVRFRSGRLFPEYRPAASPTFVPSVHSNSHRKVLEMRKKAGRVTATPAMSSPILSAAEYLF